MFKLYSIYNLYSYVFFQVTDAISDTVMCLTAGLFLYVLVERPFRLLITQLFASRSKSNTNDKK